jgi:hypothetical protein
MPIIYVHGVAVRDNEGKALESAGNQLLDRLLEAITWEVVEPKLRRFIAPEISPAPENVSLVHAYWGDLAATLAWGGASCMPAIPDKPAHLSPFFSARTHLLADLRQPLNLIGARFFGDVFVYLNGRGDSAHPGPIPQRMLDILETADASRRESGEPLIVLTNSMGCEIVYDIVTHFLPRIPRYSGIRIDYWCSVASQIGLFEELKLFLASSDAYGTDKGNRVPFPDGKNLGVWWNVWDVDDVISYSVRDIIEGVDDTPFRVGEMLLKEHVGYLQQESFYTVFAERVRVAFPRGR